MRKTLIATVAIAAVGVIPAIAAADAPPGTIGAHQHYVVTGTGALQPIGPSSCTDGRSHQFDMFHVHVHRGSPGDNGVVIGLPCP